MTALRRWYHPYALTAILLAVTGRGPFSPVDRFAFRFFFGTRLLPFIAVGWTLVGL